MDIWSWICELPSSGDWPDSNSPLVFQLASSNDDTKSILLKAERSSGSNTETLVTFSISLHGFHVSSSSTPHKTLWVSAACPLSSDKPFLPLLLQLLDEIILRSPNSLTSTCPRSQLQKLKPEPISWILDSHSPESFSAFFNLLFLSRLFWLCVFDAPHEVGSLFFKALLGPHLNPLSCKHVVRNFLISVGVDAELCFMRTLGYIVTKWLLVSNLGVGLQLLTPTPCYNFSYALESHGFWVLKGFAPVSSMNRTQSNGGKARHTLLEAKESALRYTLAHQQLEVVVQLEYSVYFHASYIKVVARVDNLRFHVVKLGFGKQDEGGGEYADEKYFPSRLRVWVGPEVGSTYVAGLSLGRSTENPENEVEIEKIVKGSLGNPKSSTVKIKAKSSARQRARDWRWAQDAEGNATVFEGVLCNTKSGVEVATRKPSNGANGGPTCSSGGNRRFGRTGGSLVFAGEEYGEGVVWRLSRDMEGSVLKWRMGAKVWLSYWPNNVKTGYYETKSVDWCEEVDLPLIIGK